MNIKRNIIFSLEGRKCNGVPMVENVPIRMRVTYARHRVEFTTGYRIDASKWDAVRQRVRNGCSNKLKQTATEINSDLNAYFSDIQSVFKEFEVQEAIPTPEQLKEAFNVRIGNSSAVVPKGTFQSAYVEFLKECGGQNNWSESTYKNFGVMKSHLISFDDNLALNDLDDDRLNEYINYLRESKGLRNSSIAKQLQLFKWFLRWAFKKGYTQNSSFELFRPKFKTTQRRVIFLTWAELTKLRDYEIPATKQYLERVRDVFLFTCFSGLRYSDAYNLKCSDIKGDRIEITTVKTADSLTIELNDHSRAILEKYKDVHFEGGKVLPVISNQKMNDYLKELCELAEINEQISETYFRGNERIDEVTPKYELIGTHAGRRTFICNALSLGIPAQVVMKWTGHSDYKAMKPYVDIADSAKVEAMARWNKKDDEDKILEQLKSISKDKLIELIGKMNQS